MCRMCVDTVKDMHQKIDKEIESTSKRNELLKRKIKQLKGDNMAKKSKKVKKTKKVSLLSKILAALGMK